MKCAMKVWSTLLDFRRNQMVCKPQRAWNCLTLREERFTGIRNTLCWQMALTSF